MKRRSTYTKGHNHGFKHCRRRRILSVKHMMVLSTVLILSFIFVCSSFADAHNDTEKYYTSVYIEKDQTLWDISGSYCSVEYSDRMEYIEEVKQLNHLTSDEIHSGNYLIVPYYDVKPL